jgi:hypothetical protein
MLGNRLLGLGLQLGRCRPSLKQFCCCAGTVGVIILLLWLNCICISSESPFTLV